MTGSPSAGWKEIRAHRLACYVAFEIEYCQIHAACRAERHINFSATLELNPQENIWDEIREKIFKNYAAKSIDEVCDMLVEGSLYIGRNPELVKSMTSFPYIASSI